MRRYRNLAGNSGVLAFELRSGALWVLFRDGCRYEYTEASVGREALVRMQRLALAGRGLSTFISRFARQRYASKRC
jgi:hypothetical protein